MKRLWLAILLALFTATAILPCEAACPSQPPAHIHEHDCCMPSGHTAEAQCCSQHQKQPAAPQISSVAQALPHLAASPFLAAHITLVAHIPPASTAPGLHKPPQLILRT